MSCGVTGLREAPPVRGCCRPRVRLVVTDARGPARSGMLPRTGTETAGMVAVAAALLTGGALVLRARRARRARRS